MLQVIQSLINFFFRAKKKRERLDEPLRVQDATLKFKMKNGQSDQRTVVTQNAVQE